MDIGINDLDFNEEEQTPQIKSVEEENFGTENNFVKPLIGEEQKNSSEPTEEKDIIVDLLKSKGIDDPKQIKFADDDGTINTKDWGELTKEEQYNILNTPIEQEQENLDDSEINLLNYLRSQNISPEEYQQMLINQGAQDYANNHQDNTTYEIDSIPDDELFVLDLQTRAENMTDEELSTALESAKANPDTYKKQVDGIRQEYKVLEQNNIKQEQAETEAEQQEQVQQFQNNILGQIDSLNSIGDMDIEMSPEDKDELAEFILGQDGAGVSNLGKALNDPETLAKMSWFALHGEEMLDDIQNYFTDQIQKARQAGYNEALGKNTPKTPEVVVKPKEEEDHYKSVYNQQSVNDINQLD